MIVLDVGMIIFVMVWYFLLGVDFIVIILSFVVVFVVVEYFDVWVILIGGELLCYFMVVGGVLVMEVVQYFVVDVFFFGVIGVDFECGFIIGEFDDVVIK